MSDDELMELGRERARLLAELAELTARIEPVAVAAVQSGQPKFYVARDAGVTRPTLDKWLNQAGHSTD